MNPFAISCRPSSFGPFHANAFPYLRDLEIHYVEIDAPAPENADALRAELEANGLEPATVALPEGIVHADDGERRLRACAEFARSWGASIFFASVNTGEAGRDDTIARLRRLGDVAAEIGMTISMETHPDLITNGEVALQTMRDVDHPNVKVNFDTANVYYYNQGIDACAELERIVDHVASMHIKDTGGGYHAWDFRGIGEGVVDFPGVLRILHDHGFRGPLTLEIEGVEGEKLDEQQHLDRVTRSVTNLRNWLAALGISA